MIQTGWLTIMQNLGTVLRILQVGASFLYGGNGSERASIRAA